MRYRTANAHSLVLVLAFSLGIWSVGSANAQSKADVFFGYAFTSSGAPISISNSGHFRYTSGRASLNGWNASASLKIVHSLRGIIDIGAGYGHLPVNFTGYGSPTQRIDIRTHLHTYLLGPGTEIPAGHMTLLGHALFGLAHQNFAPGLQAVGTRDSAFALALGGGIDVPLVSRLAFRIGADYLRTTLRTTPYRGTQQDPRVVTGLVLKF